MPRPVIKPSQSRHLGRGRQLRDRDGSPLAEVCLSVLGGCQDDGMAGVVQFPSDRTPAPDCEPEPLWREVLGRRLRAAREERGGRLVDVAERAGISPQYLSEIERGRKEPSSEMIAAVTGALGVDLASLLLGIAGDVRQVRGGIRMARRPATGPVLMAA
jgi:DNA-binding XRE family transcriptional regulator